MPRGIPKERPEEVPMRYSAFTIPPPMNSKNAASSYLKSDSQTMWARNAANATAGGKRKRSAADDPGATTTASDPIEIENKRSDILIIHPGTRFLRVGRSTDTYPINIPNVIARKMKPAPPATMLPCIPPFNEMKSPESIFVPPGGDSNAPTDEYSVTADPEDPTEQGIAAIRSSLRTRMRSFNYHANPEGNKQAATFNRNSKAVQIPDHNDPYKVDWLDMDKEPNVIVGTKTFQIADPMTASYGVRWPIRGSKFNYVDYSSRHELLGDVESILTEVLGSELSIQPGTFKNYSVILIVPDYYDKFYIREMVNIILVHMGFRRISIQQESICAAFGAGLATACVVDIGATKTSVSCVEEGLILPDTRLSLDYGGDDITELFFRLLTRIDLPYKEADLVRGYDWNMMEDLKSRSATLAEVDVALTVYELFVRAPGRVTQKYTIKTYDEPNISSMLLFDPSLVDFDKKQELMRPLWSSDGIEDMDILSDVITQAMIQSTSHLQSPSASASISQLQPAVANGSADATTTPKDTSTAGEATPIIVDEVVATTPIPDTKPPTRAGTPTPTVGTGTGAIYPGGVRYDIRREASRLPLDKAIFNSIRTSGPVERMKRLFQVVLVVGGSALTPGMLQALESRLRVLVQLSLPEVDQVTVMPAPKEIDPRVLAWKGVAVMAKLDAMSDLWVQQADWDMMGMRALKERSFFL